MGRGVFFNPLKAALGSNRRVGGPPIPGRTLGRTGLDEAGESDEDEEAHSASSEEVVVEEGVYKTPIVERWRTLVGFRRIEAPFGLRSMDFGSAKGRDEGSERIGKTLESGAETSEEEDDDDDDDEDEDDGDDGSDDDEG